MQTFFVGLSCQVTLPVRLQFHDRRLVGLHVRPAVILGCLTRDHRLQTNEQNTFGFQWPFYTAPFPHIARLSTQPFIYDYQPTASVFSKVTTQCGELSPTNRSGIPLVVRSVSLTNYSGTPLTWICSFVSRLESPIYSSGATHKLSQETLL